MCEWTFRFLSAICRVFISFHPLNELCFQVTIITSYTQHASMHMATTLFPILFASCTFWGFVLNCLAWPYLSLFLSINYFIYIKKLKNNDWLIDLDHALSTLCLRSISFEITFFICTKRINFLNLKQSSDRLVIIVKGFLMLPNLYMLIKQKIPSLPRHMALGTFDE